MDIQCAAVVVCVRAGDAWPSEAGGRRVTAGYGGRHRQGGGGGRSGDAGHVGGGGLPWFEMPAAGGAAEIVEAVADRHLGEAAVVVMTAEQLAELGVAGGTALAVDSDGFVAVT